MSAPSKKPRSEALRRRFILGGVVMCLVALGAAPMGRTLSQGDWTVLKCAFFALFTILLTQVVFAGVTAITGWWCLGHGPDRAQISGAEADGKEGMELPATAIVMPIYNEDTHRVFQGLRAMYESLEKTRRSASFDFFILSDTNDTNCWIAEERAWFELCKQTQGFGRIFYRKRRLQLHHKSGNIADFCRRWGATYRYMIVLDADSIMSGEAIVRLTTLMGLHPEIGILQTMTRPVLGQTLFQRMEQFSAYVYRPVFAAGAAFWQLGEATYWGHNAIIRLRPFIRYCAMPELPEFGPLGRRVLSHDTIEAALMRRGGHQVWEVNDIEGSYEEGPPHLLASLKRDRRWCHGNLQHLWFLFERGLKFTSRVNILIGIMAYASSPLWFFSLVLGVFVAAHDNGTSRDLISSSLLYAGIMALLLLPKFLAASLFLRSPENLKVCGSRARLALGVFAETIYSMLLAPILMLFYTRFVVASLCGFKVSWEAQVRSDAKGPTWDVWFAVHAGNLLFVVAVTALVVRHIPSLLPWLAPVLIGPLLAVPFSRFTASYAWGMRTRAAGWFVTPEEAHPSELLQEIENPFLPDRQPFFRAKDYAADYGLLQAVLDPYVNSIHVSLLRQRTEAGGRTREYMTLLADRMLLEGPLFLTAAEKRTLLWDADAMLAMHQKLWSSRSSCLHEWWQAAFRNYVESSALANRRTANA